MSSSRRYLSEKEAPQRIGARKPLAGGEQSGGTNLEGSEQSSLRPIPCMDETGE